MIFRNRDCSARNSAREVKVFWLRAIQVRAWQALLEQQVGAHPMPSKAASSRR